ncbi:MAG TPA: hypothetical protein VLB44_10580 [Kofleriaceae bacterium]|nr:hypothetical protein [Kofleriaceae bacterium]
MAKNVIVHESDRVLFAVLSGDDLDVVIGGGWVGDAWGWVKDSVGSVFSGINIGIANGNNNRLAVGNQAPTTLGDNSPITTKE